ncbi:MAG: DPP IV N-terminal domain-containing protein [Myxococcota bacterium]|nr:DPP IV N-terminal domain-containing protein [Myxococcota bacterium]
MSFGFNQRMFVSAGIIAVFLALFPGYVGAQRLRVSVEGAEFRPFPVAVPPVYWSGKKGGEVEQRLVRELTAVQQTCVDLARPLELVPPASYLRQTEGAAGAPKYADWLNVGASGLLLSSVDLKETLLLIHFRFYDTVSRKLMLSKSYSVSKKEGTKAVHRFLDEVIRLLTGKPGIFSSRIAYVRKTSGGKAVFISDMDGGNEIRVTDAKNLSLLPAWSPDGNNLLFTSFMKSNADLYRLNLKTKKFDWLSHKRGLNTGASVSRNGKKIALTLSVDGNTEIYVMNVDGSSLTRLTDDWGQDISPSWSFDGTQLTFVSSRSGQPHIYVMNSDGSKPRRITFKGNYNQEPDWSPLPGGKIVFTARDELLKYDLFTVDPKNTEIGRLTQDQGNNESPSYSPDGSQIVFTSTRPPKYGKKLYLMNADGSNQKRISVKPGNYETPAWGPIAGY